jgi:excisionase family DNA binding protein
MTQPAASNSAAINLPREMTSMSAPAAMSVLLTVEEAAQRLSIGRTTMYSLVTTGAVKSVTIGRLRRIPSECLLAYVSALVAEVPPESTAA